MKDIGRRKFMGTVVTVCGFVGLGYTSINHSVVKTTEPDQSGETIKIGRASCRERVYLRV